jgi:dipeptidyl aminopeptidase/acylaminoacyl peptidase
MKKTMLAAIVLALLVYGEAKAQTGVDSHLLSHGQVEKLLSKPSCLQSFKRSDTTYRIEKMDIVSNGVRLYCELYLPREDGKFPLAILTHGGFNEFDLIMAAPRHDAPILAHCGFAALVYHKRGTGKSGGDYGSSTTDDFINDIGNIALHLSRHRNIDSKRIGVIGGSGGGLNGPVAAARYPIISFVVNKSGPIVPREEEQNYNIDYALRFRGNADSLVEQVMPYWRKQHALWAKRDTLQLKRFAGDIIELRKKYDMSLLPSTYDEVYSDTNLVFLRPEFNSAGKDVFREIRHLKARFLSIYGEKDKIVPVQSSVANIQKLMAEGGNKNYAIIVLPEVDHSFFYPGMRRQVPVISIVLNWLSQDVVKND